MKQEYFEGIKIKTIDRKSPFSHKKFTQRKNKSCERCGCYRGLNSKHGLGLCRRCLYENRAFLNFTSYN